jgi:hypothetical protein
VASGFSRKIDARPIDFLTASAALNEFAVSPKRVAGYGAAAGLTREGGSHGAGPSGLRLYAVSCASVSRLILMFIRLRAFAMYDA